MKRENLKRASEIVQELLGIEKTLAELAESKQVITIRRDGFSYETLSIKIDQSSIGTARQLGDDAYSFLVDVKEYYRKQKETLEKELETL